MARPSFSLKWVVQHILIVKPTLSLMHLVLEFSWKRDFFQLIVVSHLALSLSSLSDKSDVADKVDLSTKRDKPVVRPEEIPPVPENRFLLRRDVPVVNVEPEP